MVPPGSEVVAMVRLPGTAAMLMLNCLVAVTAGDSASATFTVKLEAPADVGVPLMAPLLLRLRPAGRVPELRLQV